MLPIVDGGEHNYVFILEKVCTPQPDLKETPLDNPDLLTVFVDGSGCSHCMTLCVLALCILITQHKKLNLFHWLKHAVWQKVRLLQSRQIPDMHLVLCMILVHFGNRKFLKSDGKLIFNHDNVTDLPQYTAVFLPKSTVLCKCVNTHTSNNTNFV